MSTKTRAKNADARETRRFIAFINRTAKEVARWPAWMKGKPDPVVRPRAGGGR